MHAQLQKIQLKLMIILTAEIRIRIPGLMSVYNIICVLYCCNSQICQYLNLRKRRAHRCDSKVLHSLLLLSWSLVHTIGLRLSSLLSLLSFIHYPPPPASNSWHDVTLVRWMYNCAFPIIPPYPLISSPLSPPPPPPHIPSVSLAVCLCSISVCSAKPVGKWSLSFISVLLRMDKHCINNLYYYYVTNGTSLLI